MVNEKESGRNDFETVRVKKGAEGGVSRRAADKGIASATNQDKQRWG
jgi:hypothetical protein